MFFFVIISIIMFFFCLYLYFNIQKLKQQIIKLEQENKTILEKKLTPNKEDLISIENISCEINKQNIEDNKEKTNISKETKQLNNQTTTNSLTDKSTMESTLKNTYKFQHLSPKIANQSIKHKEEKYIARTNNVAEYQMPNILSPTTPILNKAQDITLSLDFNIDEFIKKDQKENLNVKASSPINSNKYLEEISKHLANEIVPQTVDLTDYEKIQEEQAIISYKELLTLKEKSNMEDSVDENFVDNLKEFYSLLD